MYDIAKRFPLKVRQLAAAQKYLRSKTEDNYCPLGIMLERIMNVGIWENDKCPFPDRVEDILAYELRLDIEERNEVYQEASDFVVDWDSGKIKDLAEALGVKDGN